MVHERASRHAKAAKATHPVEKTKGGAGAVLGRENDGLCRVCVVLKRGG